MGIELRGWRFACGARDKRPAARERNHSRTWRQRGGRGSSTERYANDAARGAIARLQRHAANAQVFEGHCSQGQRGAVAERSSCSRAQAGPRDLSLWHGGDRFSYRASIGPLCTGGICRSAHKTAAAPLFGGVEFKGASRPGPFYRGRRALRKSRSRTKGSLLLFSR